MWCIFRQAAWLDGTDPLFGRIADKYMQTMCADFGCHEHWFEADGYFAAGRPPWYEEQRSLQREHTAVAAASAAPTPQNQDEQQIQHEQCCCHDPKCSLPAKPSCCSCCPAAPVDPAAVANAKLHALAAYTGMNRTDPDAIWYYQGWILGGQFSYIKGLTEAVRPGQLVISDMWCVRLQHYPIDLIIATIRHIC